MKTLFLLFAIFFIAGVAHSQCDSCCSESFPYEFCTPLGQYVGCSSNPNADSNVVKAFIPSCVLVDTMPFNVMWQPIGPPPLAPSLLSDSALSNNSDEEAGASAQFDNDQTLLSQIPPEPPVAPTAPNPPENDCADEEPYPDPTPPSREAVWNNYLDTLKSNPGLAQDPWDISPDDIVSYFGDSDAYEVAIGQWVLDSGTFFAGDPQETYPYDNTDLFQQEASFNYGSQERSWLWPGYDVPYGDYLLELSADSAWTACVAQYETDSAAYPDSLQNYLGETKQYSADSLAWIANVNDYVQVFNPGQAQRDADSALQQWLHVCEPPIVPCYSTPPCCIHVEMDDNPFDFSSTGTGIAGIEAKTIGNGPTTITFLKCKPATCESSNMTIKVNITTEFLTNKWQTAAGPSPSQYSLYQVNQTEFFTGAVPTTETGFSDFSFFQLLEHEIGHCFGLHHPEDPVDGDTCHNCYTANPFSTVISGKAFANTSGYRAVMAQNNNVPTGTPFFTGVLGLSGEDSCQFQKLYCNSCQDAKGHIDNAAAPCTYDDGVLLPDESEFNAELFPNPTTGACQLQYEVPDRAFVQISVYDDLGKLVLPVSSGYESQGEQTLSLGTEHLASGNYVCRVRVGGNVSYINLEVRK